MIYKRKIRQPMFNDDSILPLINIIFLLIIFFMVLGSIYPTAVKTADLIKLPASANYIKTSITLYLNQNGKILKDGKIIQLKNLGLKKNQTISLIVDKTTPAKMFVKNLTAFKKIGAKKISIVVKKKTVQ